MSESMTFVYEQYDDETGDLIKTVERRVPESGVLVQVLRAFRDFLEAGGFPYVEHVAADCGGFVHSSNVTFNVEPEDEEFVGMFVADDPGYDAFVEDLNSLYADEEDYDVGA